MGIRGLDPVSTGATVFYESTNGCRIGGEEKNMDHIATNIEFQMSLLLFVSLAGYLLASRIGQPAVVGIILVGLVVGPSVLNWITYTDFISRLTTRPRMRFIMVFLIHSQRLPDVSYSESAQSLSTPSGCPTFGDHCHIWGPPPKARLLF